MPRRPHGAFLQDVALQVSAEKVRIFSDIEFFPCFFVHFSYLLIAAMVLLVSWQIDQCYFPVSLTCISGGIREEPVNPEVIGHRSDEIEMATGLVEHRSRTD